MTHRDRLELIVVLSLSILALTALPVLAEGGGTYPITYPADKPVQELAIAGVLVTSLVTLIVQGVKELFGVEGQTVRFLAVALGILLSGLALAIDQGLLPDDIVKAVNLVVWSVCGGLGGPGLYSLIKMRNETAA